MRAVVEEFDEAVNASVAVPVPATVPDVNHDGTPETAHWQPEAVVSVTLAVPPDATRAALEADSA